MAARKNAAIKDRVSSSRSTQKARIAAEIPDPWSFLEEIEAPMWADLEMESRRGYEDVDDAWFQTTHPVHEMSSRRLKSYILRGKAEKLETLSRSPILPNSVSRSRGKQYCAKKIAGKKLELSAEKHPIRKISTTNSKTSFIIPSKGLNPKKLTASTKENVNIMPDSTRFSKELTKNKIPVSQHKGHKILKASGRARKPLSVINGVDHTKKAVDPTAKEDIPNTRGVPLFKGGKKAGVVKTATVAARYLR